VKPPASGGFCWLDLAATDAARAKQFYGAVFGWHFVDRPANGGIFTQCHAGGRAVGSLYQMPRSDRERGAPAHWTPYLAVAQADVAVRQAVAGGGRLIVPPFDVDGVARIALIQDAVGAQLGLWQAQAEFGQGL
jgi:predicted enzyme related to lactoylglutathione lyase